MKGSLLKFAVSGLRAVPCRSYSLKKGKRGRYDAEPFLCRDVRKSDVLPRNPNSISALLNGADYTFLDGRPTPYGSKQVQRMEKQREYTEKIIQLTREVDMSKAIHKRHLIEQEMEKQRILESKLKQKGNKIIDF